MQTPQIPTKPVDVKNCAMRRHLEKVIAVGTILLVGVALMARKLIKNKKTDVVETSAK